MKYLMNFVPLFMISCILMIGCSSVHSSHPSTTEPVHVEKPPIKAQLKVGEEIRGRASSSYLFRVIKISGENKFADGVSYGTSQSSDVITDITNDLFMNLKSAAAYKAIHNEGCDIILDPRYTIETTDYVLYDNVTVRVVGQAGYITGYRTREHSSHHSVGESQSRRTEYSERNPRQASVSVQDASTKVKDKNRFSWTYNWTVEMQNTTDEKQSIDLIIKWLDDRGLVVAKDYQYNLSVTPDSEDVYSLFQGEKTIDKERAEKITEVTATIIRN